MNFKEPRRKKRDYHQLQRPFPIPLNKTDDWVTYTAHLSASGTCIAHPDEMAAIYCMGFFGKGSLSRGFPSFGKRRFGAPPQVRERQWKRRKQWLEDVKRLEAEPFLFGGKSTEELRITEGNEKSQDLSNAEGEEAVDVKSEVKDSEENEEGSAINSEEVPDKRDDKHEEDEGEKKEGEDEEDVDSKDKIVEMDDKAENSNEEVEGDEKIDDPDEAKARDIDEVVLDSTEDEEICEIVDNDKNLGRVDEESQGDDVCVLNDEVETLKSDNYIDLFDKKEQTEEEPDPNEMLVIPDSDSDNESYLKNIQPRIDSGGFPVNETLQLTFEETFFLMFGLGCLQVVNYDGDFFSIVEAWRHFNEQDQFFISKYIVYHYFRSKGWVVKPGIKCSADFVLYKKGPPFYHASYMVFIEVADADSLLRNDSKTPREVTWNNINTLNRLSQTLAKELLIAQVLWPSTVSQNSSPVPLEALSEFTVRESLIRRWNPNDTCETIPLDDEDDEDTDDSS